MTGFLLALISAVILFFLQQERILSIAGINPDLLLVFLAALAFFRFFRWEKFLLLLVFIFPAIFLLSGGFWLRGITAALGLSLPVYLVGRRLTGRPWLDFPIVLVAVQSAFYFMAGSSLPAWSVFFGELAYNFFVGGIFFLAMEHRQKDNEQD